MLLKFNSNRGNLVLLVVMGTIAACGSDKKKQTDAGKNPSRVETPNDKEKPVSDKTDIKNKTSIPIPAPSPVPKITNVQLVLLNESQCFPK
jgi:hypothetical protein